MRKFSRKKLEQPAQFLERLSVLLSEGYTFDESIEILSPFHVHHHANFDQNLRDAFLNGQSPEEILKTIGVKQRYLLAVSIAYSTGDLASALKRISEEMTFHEQMTARFKKMMYYPIFLFIFIIALFFAYRKLFLPRMELMMDNRSPSNDSFSLKLTEIFLNVPDYFLYGGGVITCLIVMTLYFISRKDIGKQMAIYCSMPVVRGVFVVHVTKQLARELGNLLLHGFSLQSALQLLKDQKHNKFVGMIAAELLIQVLNGEALSVAVKQNDYLTPKFEQFIVHGEKSGMLGRELLIFSDLLEEKVHSQVNTVMQFVQPVLLSIVAICVLAAYLSILLPIYKMIDFV